MDRNWDTGIPGDVRDHHKQAVLVPIFPTNIGNKRNQNPVKPGFPAKYYPQIIV
jgi:hypothetical protein